MTIHPAIIDRARLLRWIQHAVDMIGVVDGFSVQKDDDGELVVLYHHIGTCYYDRTEGVETVASGSYGACVEEVGAWLARRVEKRLRYETRTAAMNLEALSMLRREESSR